MLETVKPDNLVVVDLTADIWTRTIIPQCNHPALRAGFAGYPSNPRWNVAKYQAWKTGRYWREQLAQGKMVVRSSDSMLVETSELTQISQESIKSPNLQFPANAKQFLLNCWRAGVKREHCEIA